ncbi:hypothetical protein CEXT_815701, partial [Caerostris extrusa]
MLSPLHPRVVAFHWFPPPDETHNSSVLPRTHAWE